jgi:hypothetical protein
MSSPLKLPRLIFLFTVLYLLGSAAVPALAAGDKDWRPVDPGDLAMTEPKVEKDADAEALFWEVRVNDDPGGDLIFNHYIRIKVFTERGKESQSKVDIPFGRIFGSNIKIQDIAARTIKPDGQIVELNNKDVFERDVVRLSGLKLKAKSFALPGIEPGSIIEYRWREVRVNQMMYYLRLQFQREIPVQQVKYYLKPFPFEGYSLLVATFHGQQSRLVKDKDGYHSMTMTNMPAFREEPRMPPEDQVRTWSLVYYAPTAERKQTAQAFWKSWGKQVYELHKSDIKVGDEVKRAAAEAIGSATTSEEKLKKLDEYCRTRIKNVNDDASGLTPEQRAKVKTNKSPADTLKRGQGTSEDIIMLFAALATAAGFDARVGELGDRSDIFFDPEYMNGYFMNRHVIAIKEGEAWRFFDPASRYVPFGMLPWRSEGQDVLILDSKEPFFIKTPISAPAKSVEKRIANLRLTEDGTLEGDVRIEYYGHLGADKKEQNDDESTAEQEQTLRSLIRERMSTAEVSDIRIENVTDTQKPFTYSFRIRVPGYAERTGKRLFLQPSFFQKGMGSPFKTSGRRYDVYFSYPWSEEDNVTIELPAGFALDNADAPSPLKAGTVSSYDGKLMVTKDGRKLIMARKFFFGGDDSIIFPSTSYTQLKTVFDALGERDSHKIALKQQAATASTQ